MLFVFPFVSTTDQTPDELVRLRAEVQQLRERLHARDNVRSLIGTSAPMQSVIETVLQVAPSRATVLITGESGTGKQLVAAAIHEHSTRNTAPFIKIHCAALSESLLEAELGERLQQADGGTLFLDEIGEITPAIALRLLRFLQEHEFERDKQTFKADVRIVAATNRDLLPRVKAGQFREDLYYRLNVVRIDLPPLRARRQDLVALAMHFLRRFAKENDKSLSGFTDEALAKLAAYSWPGNVRELENVVERAVVTAKKALIEPVDLGLVPGEDLSATDGQPPIPGSTMAQLERYAILKTLEHTGGSTSRAAEILSISPRKIQYRLQEYREEKEPKS